MAQERKVFVGGVPQDLDQEDLYAIFSEYALVKKAWLQKYRTTDENGGQCSATPTPRNHRGFGFVIFHDANAIDALLGGASSRFITLRSGALLEVKRALSSNKIGALQWNQAEGTLQAHPNSQEVLASKMTSSRNWDSPAPSGSAGEPRGTPAAMTSLFLSAPASSVGHQILQHGASPAPWPGADANVFRQQAAVAHHATGPANLVAHARGTAQTPLAHRSLIGNVGMPCGEPWPALDAIAEPYNAMPWHIPAPPGLATAPLSSAAPGVEPQQEQRSKRQQLREAIMQFYYEHRPEKLTEHDFIDWICSIYEGREAELDDALRHKYGTGLRLRGLEEHPSKQEAPGADPPANRRPAPAANQEHPSADEAAPAIGWLRPTGNAPLVDDLGCSQSKTDTCNTRNGIKISDEVSRAIVGPPASFQRRALLQSVVW